MHESVQKLLDQEYAPQRSKEWYTMRESVITASDAGSVLGLNFFKTRQAFIREKCGYFFVDGKLVSLNKKPDTSSEATSHGIKYESEARDYYIEQTGEKVHEIGLVKHPQIDWLAGSPDGVTESGRLLEIKCPLKGKIDTKIADMYFVQVQLLMEILNLEVTDFVKYKPGSPVTYVCFQVQRDREWFQRILPILHDAWQEIKDKRADGLCEIRDGEVCPVQEETISDSPVQDVPGELLHEPPTPGTPLVSGTPDQDST
jgi:putative phage-type endonuclease